ncbi:MAG TPA: stage V sporulation protein SpoVM [Bacilli bacterium]|nr:stage V sporulation protein SpoVM [Bacilli bacterium]
MAVADRSSPDLGRVGTVQELTTRHKEGSLLRFYTIRLPRFLGGIVKAILNAFQKEK